MHERRDPYLVLGVPRSATLEEVRSAYRTLVLIHHPDRTGSADAQAFLDVREAYELVCDRLAREAPASPPTGTRPPRSSVLRVEPRWSRWPARRPVAAITLEPLTARRHPLDRLAGLLEAMERLAAGKRHGARDLDVELLLSVEEAHLGGEVLVPVVVTRRCRGCLSTVTTCARCRGTGLVTDEEELEVQLPPDVHDGDGASLPLDELGWLGSELRVTVRVRSAA